MKPATRGLWGAPALGLVLFVCGLAGATAEQPPAPEAADVVPPAKVATPLVSDLPRLPDTSQANARLMTTPRARVQLRPHVSDPLRIVEQSGRMGRAFSFRSIAAGIVEFLFPGSGLLRRGDPLFRLYDPEILDDLAAAEAALADYDVQPLLIAAAPRSRPTETPPTSASSPPADFPAPTTRAVVPPTQPKPEAAAKPTPSPAPKPTPQPPKPAARPQPQAASPASLRRAPDLPPVNLEPFEQALTDAQAALREAQTRVAVAQDDHEAKSKLVELGALAARNLDESAAALREARAAEADAQALVDLARRRLAAEKRAAEERLAAASQAEAAAPPDVEVVRGRQEPTPPPEVEVVRGARQAEETAGVEVVRGPTPPEPAPQPAAPARPARPATQTAVRPEAPTPQPSAQPHSGGGLDYRAPADLISRTFPPKPRELDRLAELRWTEYRAPADGFVVECMAADGEKIEAGQELVRVVNTQWARAYLSVAIPDINKFRPGTVVSVTFDDYPEVVFEGWIDSLEIARGADVARAELIVFCRKGYYGTDAFATLQWLALATPLEEASECVAPVEPVLRDEPLRHYDANPSAALSLVPRDVWVLSVDEADLRRSDTLYEGQLQLVDLEAAAAGSDLDAEGRERLARLKRWREGFVDGMTRTVFDDKVILTYPRSGEIRRAIERMATGRVTHIPNRCARTMREALGWGLGDAHVWARELPRRGYVARRDGLARPGDILVWPFSYPPRGTQHIGIAVQQNGRLMLLSNLSGVLGTSEIRPGYVAFYNQKEASG